MSERNLLLNADRCFMTMSELFQNSVLDLSRMAERFFGYGRWDAPYWLGQVSRLL